MTATTVTPDRIADLLDRAAARIEKYGLWKGDYSNWHDEAWRASCCAAGAIRISAQWGLDGEPVKDHPLVDAAEARLAAWLLTEGRVAPYVPDDEEDYGESHMQTIAAFNDAESRTATEVVTALHECAAHVREEAGGGS